MSVLLMLIPVSLLFVAAGAVAFFWAVNHDQFDDMDTPGLLPLADSDLVPRSEPASSIAAPDCAAPSSALDEVLSTAQAHGRPPGPVPNAAFRSAA